MYMRERASTAEGCALTKCGKLMALSDVVWSFGVRTIMEAPPCECVCLSMCALMCFNCRLTHLTNRP